MVKNYVLDTNTLIHDPKAIFNFQDNNVIIPFPVLEEIDKLKTRQDKVAKSARDVNRILDKLRKKGNLHSGIKLENGGILKIMTLNKNYDNEIPRYLGKSMDDFIIFYALYLQKTDPVKTIIVSKDLNLRVKADAMGIESQDYLTDKVDMELLPKGYISIKNEKLDIKKQKYIKDDILKDTELLPNMYINLNDILFRYKKSTNELIPLVVDLNTEIFGITPKNIEQVFAIDALLNPDIPFISLIGIAGTGKTLISIAAGLEMIFNLKLYKKILVSKPVIPMGKEIGFLPGNVEEKMKPWLQPIYDNLEFLFEGKGKKPDEFLMKKDILEIEVLSYIRGRSIPSQYMIIDEAQNLTPAEIKTIITRVGEGTKIILTGDPYQIDNPYLDASSNGLVYATNKFKNSELSSHVIMVKGERSNLATVAAKIL
ncbi:phosphate starvation protein PhoH [Tepiditoga spiralis]|uniref:Phosphate starvation protein PhoH n=1 Tax=Tepiditoga spiralis TaxID=2108365 RepID=A0A7G1G366_9BACT|nr:PhoH family protein [Tepiditoga spiralis]BBE30830.1 phosphate starvation protein PhoH [Tepiditoga spiralis]